MKPFRTSLTARVLSLAGTILLTGGGLLLLAGVDAKTAIPITVLLAIGGGIFSLIVGVEEYAGEVTVAAIVLPIGLFGYTMFLGYVGDGHQSLAWYPTLLGLGPLAMTIAASRVGQGSEKASEKSADLSSHARA